MAAYVMELNKWPGFRESCLEPWRRAVGKQTAPSSRALTCFAQFNAICLQSVPLFACIYVINQAMAAH